eukprot:1160397-Pelagomonas_calceolata.AAC.3
MPAKGQVPTATPRSAPRQGYPGSVPEARPAQCLRQPGPANDSERRLPLSPNLNLNTGVFSATRDDQGQPGGRQGPKGTALGRQDISAPGELRSGCIKQN